MSIQHCPNVQIGQIGIRLRLYLFIPGLWNKKRKIQDPVSEEIRDVIGGAILETAREVLPDSAYNWPASVRAEKVRATTNKGRIIQSQHEIPSRYLDQYAITLLEKLERKDENTFADARFGVFEKSTKERFVINYEDLLNENLAQTFLQENTKLIDRTLIVEELDRSWFLDIAITLQWSDKVTLIRRDMLPSVLVHAFGVQDVAKAQELLEKSSTRIDHTLLHADLAGCAVELEGNEVPGDAVFLQVYPTEKCPTYRRTDKGFQAIHLTFGGVLRTIMKKSKCKEFDKALAILKDVFDRHDSFPARFEMRVTVDGVADSFSTLDVGKLSTCLYAVDTNTWWCVFSLFWS